MAMSDESKEYKRRVTPSPDLPKLAPRLATKVALADETSAKGYDALDEAGEKMQRLTDAIEGGAIVAELEVTDSLVHFIATEFPKK